MKIAILLFEQADLLDFGGPYEVFLTASRLVSRQEQVEPFEVVSVSTDGKDVSFYGGLRVSPQGALKDYRSIDVLVVPGTIDIDRALSDSLLLQTIRHFSRQENAVIASVCTGAFLLAEAGLLETRSWTTHWEDIPRLARRIGPAGARHSVRWVDNGSIVTAAGLASGIDMALHLVHRFAGLELAQKTARQIDYVWSSEG